MLGKLTEYPIEYSSLQQNPFHFNSKNTWGTYARERVESLPAITDKQLEENRMNGIHIHRWKTLSSSSNSTSYPWYRHKWETRESIDKQWKLITHTMNEIKWNKGRVWEIETHPVSVSHTNKKEFKVFKYILSRSFQFFCFSRGRAVL